MRHRLPIFIWSIFILTLSISCNDDIDIGADLLEEDPIEVGFTDTLELSAKSVLGDSILMYENSNFSLIDRRLFFLGEIDDPTFGLTKSSVYITPRVSISVPDLSGAVMDSVVLSLPLDTLGQYGDTLATHEINVYRLSEALQIGEIRNLYTNDCFDFDINNPISTTTIIPDPRDTIDLYNPAVDSIERFVPQIRLPLDKDVWGTVLTDTLSSDDTQNVLNIINGYAIQSSPSTNSLFGVNLSNNSPATLQIFYTDTIAKVLSLDVNTVIQEASESSLNHSCFEHEYAGSEVEAALNSSGNDRVFVQGLQGVDIQVDLASALELDDRIVNFATLELFVEEEENFEAAIALVAYYRNSEGELDLIEDFEVSGIFVNSLLQEDEINNTVVNKYELLVTSHLVNLINREITDTNIVIQAASKVANPNRSIIYGPNHPDFPMRLKVITSKP